MTSHAHRVCAALGYRTRETDTDACFGGPDTYCEAIAHGGGIGVRIAVWSRAHRGLHMNVQPTSSTLLRERPRQHARSPVVCISRPSRNVCDGGSRHEGSSARSCESGAAARFQNAPLGLWRRGAEPAQVRCRGRRSTGPAREFLSGSNAVGRATPLSRAAATTWTRVRSLLRSSVPPSRRPCAGAGTTISSWCASRVR